MTEITNLKNPYPIQPSCKYLASYVWDIMNCPTHSQAVICGQNFDTGMSFSFNPKMFEWEGNANFTIVKTDTMSSSIRVSIAFLEVLCWEGRYGGVKRVKGLEVRLVL